MFQVNPSALEQYIYNMDNIGYPISEYVKRENHKTRMLGGSGVRRQDVGFAKFEDLVIPAGLVSYSNHYFEENCSGISAKSKGDYEVIADDHFDKLFGLVAKIKEKKPPANKTKKILVKDGKKTKRTH